MMKEEMIPILNLRPRRPNQKIARKPLRKTPPLMYATTISLEKFHSSIILLFSLSCG